MCFVVLVKSYVGVLIATDGRDNASMRFSRHEAEMFTEDVFRLTDVKFQLSLVDGHNARIPRGIGIPDRRAIGHNYEPRQRQSNRRRSRSPSLGSKISSICGMCCTIL